MRTLKHKFYIRKDRTRNKISRVSSRHRLSVFRSNRYIYAHLLDPSGNTVVSCSSMSFYLESKEKKSYCNKYYAEKVGKIISEKIESKGIKQVVFDKSGYKYHGVVKALADAARENLEF